MLPLFAQVEWPSAIVAIVLLLIIAAIMIIAMFRYDLDGVLKLWAAIGTLFGLVIGSMATYFFTNQAHQAVTAQLRAENDAQVARHQLALAKTEQALSRSLAAERPPGTEEATPAKAQGPAANKAASPR